MTEEEKNKQYTVARKVICIWCGKPFETRVTRGTPYTFYRWCPECQKKRAEQKEIRRRNEEYRITHKWSRKEDCIADNTKKARELGMSYGKYMALMSQLEYKRELEHKALKTALKDAGVIED